MKPLILAALALLLAVFLGAQQQSIGLPYRAPIYCSGPAGNCAYQLVYPGTTGIIVARQAGAVTITDSMGNVWTRDWCSPFDNGDCVFSTHFSVLAYDKITFPPNTGYEVFLLLYNGTWNFDSGQYGTYADQNYPFSDCTNGGDCPYSWTLPVDANAGDLLISWANSNVSGAHFVPHPGLGWSVEGNSGTFAVEDMLAPTKGVYIGALEWQNPDGSDNGGGHWLMGIAEYKKQ